MVRNVCFLEYRSDFLVTKGVSVDVIKSMALFIVTLVGWSTIRTKLCLNNKFEKSLTFALDWQSVKLKLKFPTRKHVLL